jgi:hypothetical protein
VQEQTQPDGVFHLEFRRPFESSAALTGGEVKKEIVQ